MKQEFKRDLGIFTTISIIVGQMIGSGIYMAPQGLAVLANPWVSLLAVAVTGIGTLFLALSFARLDNKKAATGSVIIYAQEAFGDLPAFWVGWSYWCGCWIANGAIVIAGLNYISYFFPSMAGNTFPKFIACTLILWAYTIINIMGVKFAGRLNLVLTILKLVPLLLFAVVAVAHFDMGNFNTVSSQATNGMNALPMGMAYMLWCFIGFEGASVSANEVKDPKQIGRLTIISTGVVIIIYIILIALAAGTMTQNELAASSSPLADIMYRATGGYWAGALISLGASISAIGCVGAWILSAARATYALGERKLMPAAFAKVSKKRGTPVNGLLINGVLMTIVMLLGYLTNGGDLYSFLSMMSVMTFLVFYLFGLASEIMISGREMKKPFNLAQFIKKSAVGLIALVYSIYTVVGSGAQYVFYGFLLILLGIPVFIYVKLKRE
ncbi:MAG: amino acid permease [Muricomes sp.]